MTQQGVNCFLSAMFHGLSEFIGVFFMFWKMIQIDIQEPGKLHELPIQFRFTVYSHNASLSLGYTW
jgi:hypothetical protein